MANTDLDLGRYKLGWSDAEDYVFKPKKGLSEEIVREMSALKGEPEWMLTFRLKALKRFLARPMAPWFAVNMPDLDFDDIYYYVKPTEGQVKDWEALPDSIKNTYEKLGIPEAERKYLAGVTAQYECLRGSTRVWTTRGMRPIKELGPGDVVFSLDRDTRMLVPAPVVAGGRSGEKEIYEVTARGRTVGASANHPMLVLRDERGPGRTRAGRVPTWVPAGELRVGDFVAVATDVPDFGESFELLVPDRADAASLPRVTSDGLCWWLGIHLGGGCLKAGDSWPTVEIAVDRTDGELVDEIRRMGSELFGLDFRLAADGLRLRATQAAALASFLELNGLGGRPTTKRLPPWVFGLPRSQRLALVAGLLDSDGCVRAGPGLLEDVDELVALSGGSGGRIPAGPEGGELDVDVRSHTSDMLGFVPVDSVERVGVEPVFDIEVAGHHNFVAEGFVVHNSEVVFHRNREDLERRGVLFSDMDTAVREYPDLVRKWFGTIIPPNDNKFAALNSAVWSGGSFIYVPPGVTVDMPLQAYFRINAENMGQFERTLIIADEGSQVHYIEGCSAPVYSTDSLHSAVVELAALPGSRITYTTIQNWSNNVYNLVTKRARAEAEAHVEWIDGNIGCLAEGSRVTTPGGVKPIELVSPGEQVLSYDESAGRLCFRTVTAKRFSGHQPVREVRVGERRLRVTDNHPFLSSVDDPPARKSGRHTLAYVRADRLEKAVLPVSSVDYGRPHKLERADTDGVRVVETTDELLRLIGVYLAGGATELDLADLFELNGFQGGAAAKRLPDWILDLPESQRLSFVAGYLDSEGCAPRGPRGFSVTSVDLPLLRDLADVVTSLGLPCRLFSELGGEGPVEIPGSRSTCRRGHRLEFRADRRLLDLVGEPRRRAALGRTVASRRRFRPVGRSSIALPESVEIHDAEVGEPGAHVPTWDIEVEGTGNFVSEGFIVHNSRLTMKYPSVYLMGPKASGEVLSVAYAGEGQHQDAGAKMIHAAPETTSTIVSKSISKDGGVSTYRGLVRVEEGAERAKSFVRCDALILDEDSVSETKPYMEVEERDAHIGHEATVSKVGEDQLFYLMSRGLSESQAMSMVVNGFIEPITRTLPMEYAVEWSRLIELQVEGSVG